jgi:hypothetical protein
MLMITVAHGSVRARATLIPFAYGLLRSRPATETVPAAGPARHPLRLPRRVRRPVSVGQTEFVIKGDWLVGGPDRHDHQLAAVVANERGLTKIVSGY